MKRPRIKKPIFTTVNKKYKQIAHIAFNLLFLQT